MSRGGTDESPLRALERVFDSSGCRVPADERGRAYSRMVGMRFAIEAVFVDRDMYVLKVMDVLPPWRMAFARRARGVLELAAGEAAARGIEIGDRLGALDLDWASIAGGSNGLGHRPPGHRRETRFRSATRCPARPA